jgi:mRNA interferase MazF
MNRKEIYWVNLEGGVGYEATKVRPCLIVSNDSFNSKSGSVTVIPFTSKTRKNNMKSHVYMSKEESDECGLKYIEHLIFAEQIRTVSASRVSNYIGKISDEKMDEVKQAIIHHLYLEH